MKISYIKILQKWRYSNRAVIFANHTKSFYTKYFTRNLFEQKITVAFNFILITFKIFITNALKCEAKILNVCILVVFLRNKCSITEPTQCTTQLYCLTYCAKCASSICAILNTVASSWNVQLVTVIICNQ